MPPHKAKFKWHRTSCEVEGQREVVAEKGPCKGQIFKVGGIKTETHACSRGGIFVAKLVSVVNIDDLSNPVGVWRLERPDGSVYSHGEVTGWRVPHPADEVLEAISAGA